MPPVRELPGEILSLSDNELANRLKQYNVALGPIVPTTRRVYERKLFELETGQQAAPSFKYEPVDDDEDEVDEESADEEVVLQSLPRQRMTRSVMTEVRRTPPRTPVTHRMADSSTTTTKSQAAQRHSSPPASKGGLPGWVKLLAILIVATIVFLVIKNLESDPAADIPNIHA